jgi:hypothetical protein
MLALLAGPVSASAQVLPEGPFRPFGGRVTLGGEIVATAGQSDDETFFNYTDYEHNALRLFRLAVSGAWRPFERLAFLGEVRSEDLHGVTPFAAYVRVRPWAWRRFDIQAGRIPPTFGVFGRRAYNTDNPLIGYPLGYQYLTSLRTEAVPANAGDLLRMRGRGWRSSFAVGNSEPGPGIPLITAFRWDTGVQVRWGVGPVEISGALTNGTLSNPRVSDDNDGKQVSGRIAVNPVTGLVLGASGARGSWLSRRVPAVAAGREFAQTVIGLDAEYSRSHWLMRGEAIWSRWALPYPMATSNGRDVRAWTAWAEGRYRITPRIFLAGRVDHLGFSTVQPMPLTEPRTAWDAPVDRLEGAVGYYLQRNLVARFGLQANWRRLGRDTNRTFVAGQLAWWF